MINAPPPVRSDPAKRFLHFARTSGPLFLSLAEYLAGRTDLLPLRDCLVLAAARTASDDERCGSGDSVAGFQGTVTGLDQASGGALFERYRGTLDDGRAVDLKCLRPGLVRRIESDIGLLRILQDLQVGDPHWDALDPARLESEFTAWIERRIDLEGEARDLEAIAAAAGEELAVGLPVPEYCDRTHLVTERVTGTTFDELRGGETGSPVTSSFERGDIARRFAFVWLQAALLGGGVIEDLVAGDVVVDDGRFTIRGGRRTVLDRDTTTALIDYLGATVRDQPDLACTCLLEVLEPAGDDVDADHLHLLLRQAEPFRDDGWVDGTRQSLASLLFVHWRMASRTGYRLRPGALAFTRSLTAVHGLAGELAEDRDAFRQGLDDLRVVAAAHEMRRAFGPSRLMSTLERVVPVAQEVVERLREVSLATDGRQIVIQRRDDERRDNGVHRRGRATLELTIIALMAVLAVVVPKVAGVWAQSNRVESAAALIFVGLAGLVLGRSVAAPKPRNGSVSTAETTTSRRAR